MSDRVWRVVFVAVVTYLLIVIVGIAVAAINRVYCNNEPAFTVPPDTFVFDGWKHGEKQWRRVKRDTP